MTTAPQPVLARIQALQESITQAEGELKLIDEHIAALQAQSRAIIERHEAAIRELKTIEFVRDEYERVAPANDERAEAEAPPEPKAKERIYATMRAAGQPMRAAEVADLIGMDIAPVGTYFGHLSRAKLIKQAENGAWIAVDRP